MEAETLTLQKNAEFTYRFEAVTEVIDIIDKKLRFSKVNLNILRIDIVNTKNNLSIFNTKNPNFRDLLFQNKNYFNKFFFK